MPVCDDRNNLVGGAFYFFIHCSQYMDNACGFSFARGRHFFGKIW